MCGRYVQTKSIEAYSKRFAFKVHQAQANALAASWNLAPTRLSWTIRDKEADLEAVPLRWGFGQGMPAPINARVETAETKFTFCDSWKHSRCIIPADGWYEWKAEAGGKQPYYFTREDGEPIYFAGLWTGDTFCMFTMDADGPLTAVHHRKPVSLDVDKAQQWIKVPMSTLALQELAVRGDSIKFFPVSKTVSNARNDGASLIEPASAAPKLELERQEELF